MTLPARSLAPCCGKFWRNGGRDGRIQQVGHNTCRQKLQYMRCYMRPKGKARQGKQEGGRFGQHRVLACKGHARGETAATTCCCGTWMESRGCGDNEMGKQAYGTTGGEGDGGHGQDMT